jgi:hypothetical protein
MKPRIHTYTSEKKEIKGYLLLAIVASTLSLLKSTRSYHPYHHKNYVPTLPKLIFWQGSRYLLSLDSQLTLSTAPTASA